MSDKEGFIVLHRKIIDWEWYTDTNTAHLFMHCILRANFKDTTWRGISVKRGSFVTSLETLSAETGLTVKQIRIALQKLINTGEVANKSTSKFRIITVNNYDLYQKQGKQKGKQEGKQRADKRADERAVKGQTEGKQRATDNNNNNVTMKTSEGLCLTGTKPSHKTTKKSVSPDPAQGRESVSPQKNENAVRDHCPPLNTSEWLRYCSCKDHMRSEDDIWEEWEQLDNGRRLSTEEIKSIRETIYGGK